MPEHGIKVSQQSTGVATPNVAKSGIPFVIGAAPVQSAVSPAAVGAPVLCTSWGEAVSKLGFSENWASYDICEFMYSHFKLFGCQPVIFCNLLDPKTMKTAAPASDVPVTNHKVELPIDAINDVKLVVKAAGGAGAALIKGTDYDSFYGEDSLVIELLSTSASFSAASLSVAYDKVNPAAATHNVVAAGMENIERCLTTVGMAPDLICSPGHAADPTVAAVMSAKAAGINGMFGAKALIEINTADAADYTAAIASKSASNFTDKNQIVCWGVLKLGERKFRMTTQLAGLMAQVDTDNGGVPNESPSNKGFKCDGMVLASGEEVNLTLAQANILNANGIVTALNFMGGWVCWGNYTACHPYNTDVKDYFIPVSRTFDWVGNTLIRTFWSRLDKQMNRRFIDSIMDSCKQWLNGLVGSEYVLGARVEFKPEENPEDALRAGIIKLHIYITPPSPAQEIDFVVEYDASYVSSALQN